MFRKIWPFIIVLLFIGCGDAPHSNIFDPEYDGDSNPGGFIAGQVISHFDEGGVSRVVVYTEPPTTIAVTDTFGFFTIDSIPPGDYVVKIADTLAGVQTYVWDRDSAMVTVHPLDTANCGQLNLVRSFGWDFEDVSVGEMPSGTWLATDGTWQVENMPSAPFGTRVLRGDIDGTDTSATLVVPTGTRVSYGFFTMFRFPSDSMVSYYPSSAICIGMRYTILSFYGVYISPDGVLVIRNSVGTVNVIASYPFDIGIGDWHAVEVSLCGDYIHCKIDEHSFPAVYDDNLRTGGGTFISTSRIRTCTFDDMMVLY